MAIRPPYDPNPIPHAGRDGRPGEISPDEPETWASSVEAPQEGEDETPLPRPGEDPNAAPGTDADDGSPDRRRAPPAERRRR